MQINADTIEKLTDMALQYAPKLGSAIIVLIIGLIVVKAITKGFVAVLNKSKLDASLKPFLTGIINTLLKVLLFVSVLGMIGIEMTSFIAILGAVGLAVGMALSGTLQNFAGGVMILTFKPYRVGDFIEAKGYSGTVSQIQIFNTVLRTGDNKTIIIPNGQLNNSSMINFSVEEKRRVDWTFGIAYGDDADLARAVIKELCDADERIHKDPEVFIAVSALADSSVNFVVRAWVDKANYWPVFFAMNEKVYKTFPQRGLNIPFPQMDVHLHKEG
ncbi:mechanosensitive ion channel [Psychrosphaera ytuae]|uniref:Small-conductance mechanosensitive channel n=1 Tax=Psychrosphaera ytuae TaxID=2820710 RepID=A0A975HJB7_9GAMM|nr:mechanosensitive ion channel domain-containing protein [Psychrosphaera ytuae]QTH63044.1 mechanosensitive ion channel [Psychrosphaera ytuae]